jgi:hypothetical protein
MKSFTHCGARNPAAHRRGAGAAERSNRAASLTDAFTEIAAA